MSRKSKSAEWVLNARRLCEEARAARLRLFGRACSFCGTVFVPDDLRHNPNIRTCPTCVKRITVCDSIPHGTRNPRAYLVSIGQQGSIE